MKAEKRTKNAAIWLCTTAMFMALNIAMSSFGVPVPGGHLYLNDIVICLAAIILDPVAAFAVGGIGAFLGDFFFYPAPMFVSLVTHGLQAVVISLISHHALKKLAPCSECYFTGAVVSASCIKKSYPADDVKTHHRRGHTDFVCLHDLIFRQTKPNELLSIVP